MSTKDMMSLHDVYEGIDEQEECQNAEYVLQFHWRDVSSILMSRVHILLLMLLAFNQFGFKVRVFCAMGPAVI